MRNKALFCGMILMLLIGCSSRKLNHHQHPHHMHRPPPQEKIEKKAWIMIDPGHGGEDFGTRSLTPPRYQEKYLNLATAYMLKDLLQQKGYHTILTRHKDVFVSLEQRAKFANHEKPTLFVSVHYNAAPSVKASGVEVYYYRSKENKERSADSKKLADDVLSKILKQTQAKSRGVKHGDFSVIRETTMPAILVEGGFLSNDEEMNKLKDPMYLKKIALGIAEGIDKYLSS